MLRKHLRVLCILLIVASAALVVYAGMHIRDRSATVTLGSLRVSVDISGFGNDTDTVTSTLTVQGTDLTAMCQNHGGTFAPGQNPVDVSVSATQTASPDKNGSAEVDFHVNLLPSSGEAGCPNRNWRVTDLLGTLYVNLFAIDNATGDSDTLNLVCAINEAQQQVTCTEG